MYYRDLTSWNGYQATGPFKAVGWLSKDHPFECGELDSKARSALLLFMQEAVTFWVACGHHCCEFCPNSGPWTLANTSSREIFVPAIGVIYVAPVLILHYVEAHQYKPPDEFINALLACPRQLSDEWRTLMKQSPYFAECLESTSR